MYARKPSGTKGDKGGKNWKEVIVRGRRKYKSEKIECERIKAVCEQREMTKKKKKVFLIY